VDVRFQSIWHVIVDDVRYSIYVDTAGGDISGDKHPELPALKAVESSLTLSLGKIALEGCRWDAVFRQSLAETLCHMLHLCENNHNRLGIRLQPRLKCLWLVLLLDRVHGVGNQCHWKLALYLNYLWVLENNARKLLDLVWHSGGEEHRLALFWNRPNDLLDVR
jgi:hypothetical protein